MEILSLRDLGWSPFLQSRLDPDEGAPVRVAAVHRTAVDVLGPVGPERLALPPGLAAGEVAVGDWLVRDREVGDRIARVVERKSLLSRRAAGTGAAVQLIAANVDTLFIVTSCNADFNPARIERYLALALQSGVTPVVVLTKADLCRAPEDYLDRARAIPSADFVELLDAREAEAAARLGGWCGPGQTVALAGMSGVGKSTLANALTGAALETGGIRDDDARGRHTTTVRSLHRTRAGGWLIDTPGMRALRLADAADGIAAAFGDVEALAGRCRFADCGHVSEPGCAVRAAVEAGTLDPDRLERWRKLAREDARNSATLAQSRAAERAFGRMARRALAEKRRRQEE